MRGRTVEIDVTETLGEIDLAPSSVLKEVLQNVRTIVSTKRGTVPLDREFGLDPALVDLPIATAQAKMTADIVATVHKYEPRAFITQTIYHGSEMDGQLHILLRVAVADGA